MIEKIKKQLKNYAEKDKKEIPNLLFYGSDYKHIILNDFLKDVYHEKNILNENVLYIHCTPQIDIYYVREKIIFFAKSISFHYKTIVFINPNQLTFDVQSSLRRCIEIYSKTTRFIIVCENKHHLLKPILSRFFSIYIPPYPIQIQKTEEKRNVILKKNMKKLVTYQSSPILLIKINQFIQSMIERGYSALDILSLLEKDEILISNKMEKMKLLYDCEMMKKEIRNESIFLFYIINKLFLTKNGLWR